MHRIVLNNILLFIVLIISQSVIFNNLILFNCAIAFVFLYMIIELPVTLAVNWVMTISFFLGLGVDIFQDTPGLNALCCTLLAFMRRPIFHLYVAQDEDYSGKRLGIACLGASTFLKYMLTMVLVYMIFYFCIDAINYNSFLRVALRIVASTAYTFVVIYAIESLTLTRREKRL